LVVHHTPGHTEGSISLFLYDKKILFCGDTVPYILGKIRSPNPYSLNHKMEFLSLKKLSKLDPEILLPGDCRIVMTHGKETLEEFCNKELGIRK